MNRQTGRRRWQIGIPLGVVALAVLAIVLWAGSGNQAASTSNAGANQLSSAPADKTLSSRYFSFRYPGIYHVTSQTVQPPDLADYMLVADTSYDKQVAVTMTPGDISTTSGYIYRRTRNDLYSSQPIVVAGETASLWTKNDASEETVFIPHNGTVTTLSFSVQNTNATEGLSSEVTTLLGSFRWQ